MFIFQTGPWVWALLLCLWEAVHCGMVLALHVQLHVVGAILCAVCVGRAVPQQWLESAGVHHSRAAAGCRGNCGAACIPHLCDPAPSTTSSLAIHHCPWAGRNNPRSPDIATWLSDHVQWIYKVCTLDKNHYFKILADRIQGFIKSIKKHLEAVISAQLSIIVIIPWGCADFSTCLILLLTFIALLKQMLFHRWNISLSMMVLLLKLSK